MSIAARPPLLNDKEAALNKTELIAGVARSQEVSLAKAAPWVNTVLQELAKGMAESSRVTLHELGVFRQQRRRSKAYRHPLTGRMGTMPETSTIAFTPSQPLRRRMEATDLKGGDVT